MQAHRGDDGAATHGSGAWFWVWMGERTLVYRRLCLPVLAILAFAACSPTGARHGSASPTSPPIGTSAPEVTSTRPTQAPTSSTASTSPSTATPSTGPSFAAISGTYVAGTADGGWIYIRSDGAARFRGPDQVACSSCATAGAPIASLDFSLTSISGEAGSGFSAEGKVTGTSDPAWASGLAAPSTNGSLVSVSINPSGGLSLNLLPANDVLTFASKSALYSEITPCTVAAVSPPIAASSKSQQVTVDGVRCSPDGEWAEASVAVQAGSGGFDEVVVLAGNGSTWIVVDRPTVCNGHDITPAFYNTACGTS